MSIISETNIETFAIEVLKTLGWEYVQGLSIAPNTEYAEMESFEQIILTQRLRKAVAGLNLDIYQFLVEKIKIPYQQDGYERSYEV